MAAVVLLACVVLARTSRFGGQLIQKPIAGHQASTTRRQPKYLVIHDPRALSICLLFYAVTKAAFVVLKRSPPVVVIIELDTQDKNASPMMCV